MTTNKDILIKKLEEFVSFYDKDGIMEYAVDAKRVIELSADYYTHTGKPKARMTSLKVWGNYLKKSIDEIVEYEIKKIAENNADDAVGLKITDGRPKLLSLIWFRLTLYSPEYRKKLTAELNEFYENAPDDWVKAMGKSKSGKKRKEPESVDSASASASSSMDCDVESQTPLIKSEPIDVDLYIKPDNNFIFDVRFKSRKLTDGDTPSRGRVMYAADYLPDLNLEVSPYDFPCVEL